MQSGQVDELVYRLNSSLTLEKQALHRQLDQLGSVELHLRDERLIVNRERADLAKARKELAEERAAFEDEVKTEWSAPAGKRRVALNVGGQLFETTSDVLCRDRFSLLAAICSKKSTTPVDRDGAFFIDRDWWIFRHILAFLRDGSLPSSSGLLRELYVESAAYRLGSLRAAIERKFANRHKPRRAMTGAELERRDLMLKEAAVLSHTSGGMPAAGATGRTPMETIAAGADTLAWMDGGRGMGGPRRAGLENSLGMGAGGMGLGGAYGAPMAAMPGTRGVGPGMGMGPGGMGSTAGMGMGAGMGVGAGMGMGMGMGAGGAGFGGARGMARGFNGNLAASGAFAQAGAYRGAGGLGGRGMMGGTGQYPMGSGLFGRGAYPGGAGPDEFYAASATRRMAHKLPDPYGFTGARGTSSYLDSGYTSNVAESTRLPDPYGFSYRAREAPF